MTRFPASTRRAWAVMACAGWVSLASLALATAARAQEVALPVPVQYPLLLKILQFDKNLRARAGDRVVVGVVYQGRFRASRRAKEEMMQAALDMSSSKVSGLPVRVVPVDIERKNLSAVLDSMEIDVVYITPLRSIDIGSLTRSTRSRGITSMTGVEDYVRSGVAVGVGIWQEKPSVMVNVGAARAEGADFSSRLLSLARRVE